MFTALRHALVLVLLFLVLPAHGQDPAIEVAIDKARLLRVPTPFAHVAVGNPAIADVVPMTDRAVQVLGKATGATTLSLFDRGKQLVAVHELVVTADVDGLKRRLHELMPDQPVEVRAVGGAVVLSGTVSSAEQAGRALALAEHFAPKKVTNMLRVGGSQQVMLAVRVAEVSRSVARELGVKPGFTGGDFNFATLDPLDLGRFATAELLTTSSWGTLDLLFDALEEKGMVKVLAEPNLIALSGDTANFLAGGEFPIPVAQAAAGAGIAITVEFKKFGVGLAFTPTVLGDGLINLVVSPEVSQIDRTNAVALTGFSIPGLTTRRATTTVELRAGQSFAIAGLLQNDFQDQVRQIPGIGDIPILGALFRSSEFQRRETELVIIVTPHLVRPVAAGTLAAPTDGFLPPTDADLFLMGRVAGPATGGTAPDLAGRYGYLVP
ncbi:type II and III secretion system protein family protein [Magnetospirillum sp. UT-4]|uniref:type II and III secretion system protein family protein n=1 Tax=Magnetospirillum sp. UT-4 TaxID=2681467 RepID=UPI00138557B4|nr:type II and III secretion system protein family protein [Magnetospirillum sp. UT-4]CAA7615391.1 Type II/IV secretion system secretin RcpA/CpaC [Magnetospirillum sp. UT-4]